MERRESHSAQSTSNLNNGRESRQSRPASSLGIRTTSALSSYAITSNTLPKTPAVRSKNGGLNEAALQNFEQTLKTVTRAPISRTGKGRERIDPDDVEPREKVPTGSFLTTKSFSRSPLNSRVAPISPHRVTMQSTSRRQIEDSFEGEPEHELSIEQEEEEYEVREKIVRKREGLDKQPLKGLSADLKEAYIVEDLLFVLMGIEGNYFEYDPLYSPEDPFARLQGAQFVVDPEADGFRDVIDEVLPLATHYTAVHAFVEQYSMLEHGVINHALCAAIRELLRDYLLLIAQLENLFLNSPFFNRQVLLVHLRPYSNNLKLIHSLTSELIYLSLPADDDEDSSDDDSSDDGADIGGMKAALAEMKAANGLAIGRQTGVAKGGEVLYVISQKLEQTRGDPIAKDLYETLLLRSSQPYVEILLAWISTGHLDDPWEEFIVREQKGIDTGSLEMDYTDEYWEKRYTLRDKGSKRGRMSEPPRMRGLAGGAVLPTFLDPFKNKILLAGKYLNVIRECGIEIKVSEGERGRNSGEMVAINDEEFFKRIEDAYTYANKTLLKLLLEEQHLVSRLRSIKQYFFMDHGDAFTHFLDIAKGELNKKKKNTSPTKLQALLDLALKNPAAASAGDPFNEDIKVALGDQGLTEWLISINSIDGEFKATSATHEVDNKAILAYEVFTLDYQVKFPLSLVISRRTIVRYQCIFRHLLQLKRLERILSETWLEHIKSPIWKTKSKYPEVEKWKFRMLALRARMYSFIQQMYDFAVKGVLELNWRALEIKLEKVETVDQLVKDHADFLDTCMKGCLLTNEKLLVIHSKLLTCCTIFVSYTSSFAKTLALAANTTSLDQMDPPFSKHWDTLNKFEINFNHHNQTNLERINFYASGENNALLPLVIRLSSLEVKTLQVKHH